MSILTTCAACATELGLTLGKKCGRCSTRYCGPECQKYDWEEEGHDKLCKKIKKAGGAEQYNANTKYTEAVSVAATACADDTKGQTCYICTEAVHRHTGEGLVRGCACHTTEGFVHVSCLAEQAKILVAEAEENNLDDKMDERWRRWYACSLCEQQYHGVVMHALGWACFKTYLGRPETDTIRFLSLEQLGNGLNEGAHYEDALSVDEARLSFLRRLGASEEDMLVMQGNLANSYEMLGRDEEALPIRRDVYSETLKIFGISHEGTLREASNYASTLKDLKHFDEAKSLLQKTMPVARRVLGASHGTTLRVRWIYAQTLYKDAAVTLDDLREAVATLEDVLRIARRVLGPENPTTSAIKRHLPFARAALRAREAPPPALR